MIAVKNEGLVRRLSKLNKWEDLLTPIEWRGYYSLLNDAEKEMYEKLLEAICECQYHIYFHTPISFTDEEIGKILHFVLYDNPAIIDINEYTMWDIVSDDHMDITVPFTFSNALVAHNRRVNVLNAIKDILSANESVYMQTDFDKELFVHDYICKNVVYDSTFGDAGNRFEPFSIYGPLLEKSGVCEGVAKLTKLLLEILGLRSFVVSGVINNPKRTKRAWNLVMLNDKAFHLDVTLDMCETHDTDDLLRRDFFNVSDTIMDREVSWAGKDLIWKCDSFDYNYVYLVGGYVSSEDDCIDYLRKKLREKRQLIYVRLNKKTLGDIDNQIAWVKACYCEAANEVMLHFKGVCETSQLNGLVVMHIEYMN